MLEKFRLERFRFTYLALSSFLLSFYTFCDGEARLSVLLLIAGVGAIVLESVKKNKPDSSL